MWLTCGYCLLFLQAAAQLQMAKKKKKKKSKKRSSEVLKEGISENGNFGFDVHKSVHHHTIQIIQPTRCNSFTSLLLDVYVWLNMFRASPCPSSGA